MSSARHNPIVPEDSDDGNVSNTEGGLETPLLSSPGNNSEQEQETIDNSIRIDGHRIKESFIYKIVNIYSDQSGSCSNLTHGLTLMMLVGALLGIVMPKNPDLPHASYRLFSSIIGYIYFVSWSVSYYPQIITNFQRKSIHGLSTDSYILAILNNACYSIYNSFFFWNETIRSQYKDRHGADAKITVQSNDVAFALHALFLTLVVVGQIGYYGGFQQYPISNITKCIVGVLFLTSGSYIVCIYWYDWLWIDFLYLMASFKLVLTTLTYLPQILLNCQRKSTDGWNIWNVIFDFIGGLLSMLQLVWDSIDLDDLRHGIMGNWAKLLLGVITLVCDGAFFAQHSMYSEDHDNEVLNQIDNGSGDYESLIEGMGSQQRASNNSNNHVNNSSSASASASASASSGQEMVSEHTEFV